MHFCAPVCTNAPAAFCVSLPPGQLSHLLLPVPPWYFWAEHTVHESTFPVVDVYLPLGQTLHALFELISLTEPPIPSR